MNTPAHNSAQDDKWSACVGAGWKQIVDALAAACERDGVAIRQVKEKYGGLRFYTDVCSERLQSMIDGGEHLSVITCEHCGKPGQIRDLPWTLTLCDEHYSERKP